MIHHHQSHEEMKMKTKHFALIVPLTCMFFSASLFLAGCSASKGTEEETTEENEVEQEGLAPPTTTAFTVQIGAFHNAVYAEQAYRKAMQDFTEPVYEDYDASRDFTRITVGNFRTKTDALDFRRTCVRKGYKDAWVIEVKRTEAK
jgi:cell division protein FtsN